VLCTRADGFGLAALKKLGIAVQIISTEANGVVAARAKKLGVPALHGIGDKCAELTQYCKKQGFDLERVVYVGNDINDVECMKRVGCAVAPADAHECAKTVAHIVLEERGGEGCVRALCDLIAARAQESRQQNKI